MLSLWVELDKTQIAAEAAVGQGSLKVLREMQTYKKHKILHQYVCFCSAIMLTSKIITESVENHSECCGCMNPLLLVPKLYFLGS